MNRFPLRIGSLLVIVGTWNGLILLDLLILRVQELPGPGSILALGGVASISGLLPVTQALQRWLLMPSYKLSKTVGSVCYGVSALCVAILIGGIVLLIQ